ncbi:MAG: D-tyrosyl-tRNA(Tyr) deacylase [Planctomycetota bacterium]|nr:MAG: D-tyrosyl-tRNA(Tyr) deacylase [Planctomycetota bacterium]
MRAVLQRVCSARVCVDGNCVGAIGRGLLVFLGIAEGDGDQDQEWLLQKIARQRLFPDSQGKMNCSVADIGGGFLVVSQFTLLASTRKGNRPSFTLAADPQEARRRYEQCLEDLAVLSGCPVASGQFAADMQIEAHNDGPVTIVIDSRWRE